MTFEEQFPSLKEQDCPDYEMLSGIYTWLDEWFRKHTASVHMTDGTSTLKEFYSFHDEFEYLTRPHKLGIKVNPRYDQEAITEHCLDKQRVKDVLMSNEPINVSSDIVFERMRIAQALGIEIP